MNRVFKFLIISLLLIAGLYAGFVLAAPFEVLRSEIFFVNPGGSGGIAGLNGTYLHRTAAAFIVDNFSLSNLTVNITGYINGTNSTYQVELLMQLGAVNGSRAPNNGTGGAGAQNNESVWHLGIITTFGNGSVLVNGSNFSIVSNRSIPDGNHTWYFNVSNKVNGTSSSNMSSFNLTYVVDTSRPLIEFSSETENNNTNLTSRSNIFVNISFNESNVWNVTFILANGTGLYENTTPSFNKTVFVNGNWSTTAEYNRSMWVNYSSLVDGNYTINVSVTDRFNNKNKSLNLYRFITIDTLAPSISVSASPTGPAAGETVTLVCTATDAQDASPVMELAVKRPGHSNFEVISGSPQTAYAYTDTTGEGQYTVRCTSTDRYSVSGSSTKTFTVATAASTGTGGAAGGAAGGSVTSENEVTPEEEVVPAEAEEVAVSIAETDTWDTTGSVSYTDAVEGTVYSFDFVDASGEVAAHSIEVKELNEADGLAVFIVQSDAQEVQVAVGESKEVDLDGDGVSDLLITLNGISDGVADVSFAKAGTWTVIPTGAEKVSLTWLWVILALVVVALVVYWSMRRK